MPLNDPDPAQRTTEPDVAYAVPDPQWLRAFLLEKGIRKPKARWGLSDQALVSLGGDITLAAFRTRVFGAPAQFDPITAALQDTATQTLAELFKESLATRRAAFLALKTQSGKWSERVLTHWIARIDAIIAALEQSEHALAPLMPSPNPCTTWRDQAVELARAFVGYIRDCNPGHLVGISPRGPLAAYIWAVAPLITGEKPSLDSVAGYLQEHREEVLKR